MLDVRELAKTYHGRERTVEAIHDLTFTIADGDFTCLVGPSGCGKTTLLRCIAGLLTPTAGDIYVQGTRVTGPPPSTAVVFQEYGRSLFPWMSVHDNVELPLRYKNLPRPQRRELVTEALDAVGLADTHRAYPWQLSGGMQQRVAIARALAHQPEILLMDEPFAAVDAQTRADLEDLVRALWQRLNITVLFITHDIDEAVYLGQHVITLSSTPTVVQAELTIDLPQQRDQLHTRADPHFAKLRTQVYEQIQTAKRGTDAIP